MAEKKSVTLITTDAFKHDGEHFCVGQLLTVDADLALELTGAGRTRMASAEEVAAVAKKAAKVAA